MSSDADSSFSASEPYPRANHPGIGPRAPRHEENEDLEAPMRISERYRRNFLRENRDDIAHTLGESSGEAEKIPWTRRSSLEDRPGNPSFSQNDSFELDEDASIPRHPDFTIEPLKNVLRKRSRPQKDFRECQIVHNESAFHHKVAFLYDLAGALIAFEAPSNAAEHLLNSSTIILDIDAQILVLPSEIVFSVHNLESDSFQSHSAHLPGRLALGRLTEVYKLYLRVMHDEISAEDASKELKDLMDAKPTYSRLQYFVMYFIASGLLCPLAYGGSFLDMWIAGVAGALLSWRQARGEATLHATYAGFITNCNLVFYEIGLTFFMSFVVRGLSSIRSNIFCYTSSASTSIAFILPVYMMLTGFMDLTLPDELRCAVKLVYPLVYMFLLEICLVSGSNVYLLFDSKARTEVAALVISSPTIVRGLFVANNATNGISPDVTGGGMLDGIFTFMNPDVDDIILGCYRPQGLPWYLQQFPWWTELWIVPIISVLLSMAYSQPLWTLDMLVMVIFSCVAYTVERLLLHYLDFVPPMVVPLISIIATLVLGLLGNIYARKLCDRGCMVMIPGALLVAITSLPRSGLDVTNMNGITVPVAMVALGTALGLKLSQAILCSSRSQNNTVPFSF